MALFKFFPKDDDLIEKIFIREHFCTVKCSLPKDYNDPYELFLGVDNSVGPNDLAFYHDVIQEISQYPTTCFSRSIISLPMWAHYASNQMGFVIEFDLDLLKQYFPDVSIANVKYISEPDKNIAEVLKMASGTLKPRYLMFLNKIVYYNAYFSKFEEWSYEKECRLVATGNYTETINSNDLLFIPIQAIKSIILGKSISHSNKNKLIDISKIYNLKIYQINISKTNSSPFFTDLNGESYIYNEENIILAPRVCKFCPQPLLNNKSELCEVCSISEAHKVNAMNRNTFRLLDHVGILDEYINGFRGISKNK